MPDTTATTYISGDWEWNHALNAYETAYAVIRFDSAPVVSGPVLRAIVARQQMLGATDDMFVHMISDGDGAIVYDADGNEDAYVVADADGNIDLAPLGWAWDTVGDADVIRRVGP